LISAHDVRNDFLRVVLNSGTQGERAMNDSTFQELQKLSAAEKEQLIVHLLNAKTKEIQFDDKYFPGFWDMEKGNCCFVTFVKMVSDLAPNLESLVVNNLNQESICSPFSPVSKPLENLKILRLDCWRVSDPDLDSLTLMAPNLEQFMVCIIYLGVIK
jgi:hypothetical protein